jgi:hypothetical protein
MPDRPPKDLAGIVASLIFVATIVVLMIIGAVLLSPLSTAGRRAAAAPRISFARAIALEAKIERFIPVSRSTRRETSSRALTIALREGWVAMSEQPSEDQGAIRRSCSSARPVSWQ